MKHTKRTLTLLLAAMMLSTALLPMAGCTSQPTLPDSPFNDTLPPEADPNGDKEGDGQPTTPDLSPDTSLWEGTAAGEKRLYGKQNLYQPRSLKLGDRYSSLLRWGDLLIGETRYSNQMGFYTIDEPNDARLLCFDPLCPHWPGQESCTSVINRYMDMETVDESGENYVPPMGWYIDEYESTNGPVIYLYYRRSGSYTIGFEEQAHRDPVYCIERYEMALGRRTPVIDGIEDTITQACNYGDSIYYLLDKGFEVGKEIYCIDKSGKERAKLELDKMTESVRIVDVVDDMFYYMVDEQYIYRATLDLTESEMVLDLSTLKGKDDSVGVAQGSYNGYFYYSADVEKVTAMFRGSEYSTEKANLYRIPMNDLTKEPELIVEGMNFGYDEYLFAEKTFYYTPCFFNSGGIQPSNSDGKLMALDLTTGESKTIVEGIELNIYPKLAWDDIVVFSGTGYTQKGSALEGKLIMAYTSGERYKIWGTGFGSMTDEYLETLRAASKAAINRD